MYVLLIQSVNALQVRMSSSGIVIHYIDEVVKPPTPRKYTVFNGNFVFDLHIFDLRDIFQECNPGENKTYLR